MSKIEELQSKCRSMEIIMERVDRFVDEINKVKDVAQEEVINNRDMMRRQVLKDLDELYGYIKDKNIFLPTIFDNLEIRLGQKILRYRINFNGKEYAGSGPIERLFAKAGVKMDYSQEDSYKVAYPHLIIYDICSSFHSDICYVDGYWNEDADIIDLTDRMFTHWPEILEQMYENIIQEYEVYMKRVMTMTTQEYSNAVCKRDKLIAVNSAMQDINN